MNPIKPNLKTEILPISIIILMAVLSFFFYQNFPSEVPVHWNFQGEVDNYGSKEMGAFLFPAIVAAVYLMFLTLPFIDPKKERYEQFRKVYHIFKALLMSFMLIIYILTSLSALGYDINISLWISAMVGLLFVFLGNYFGKLKPNWFMGIRTPWTLSSEEVWNKTHRFSGKIYIVGGLLLTLITLIPEKMVVYVFVSIIILLVMGPIVYSFLLYKKLNQKNGNNQ